MSSPSPSAAVLLHEYQRTVLPDRNEVVLSIPDTRQMSFLTQSTRTDVVPESVLRYERQMRKKRAADKAGAPVTKQSHLDVVHADEHIVVTNKPSGILCVPGINHHPSLLTVVYEEYGGQQQQQQQEDSVSKRMNKMVIHRLDMDTSGLVLFGRTDAAVSRLHAAFRDRHVRKTYVALVCGHVQEDGGRIELPLQRDHRHPPLMRVATPHSEHEAAQAVQDLQTHGFRKLMQKKPKPSTTLYRVLSREYYNSDDATDDNTDTAKTKLPVTRLALTPVTGRTHQLRVHCAALGHPIVGDPAYGVYGEAAANGGFPDETMDQIAPHRACLALQQQINDRKPPNLCLHAHELVLRHPVLKRTNESGDDDDDDEEDEPIPGEGKLMRWKAPTPF